ncbi:hypothetical protein N2603_35775 [Bradyrhizobium huanghuaihaiense]|uniref:hypothetical protein n=1 Tax=Bradyrhizobium huanghuaihaiense TaxID=990078 RepID=UPI0021A98C8A|nr:hypothetical protein [Bradyrhizobium sp. CB3035]UWU75360.1 hypothetical protein N2603_35775 [Bradyrhizobium sp. CB3035]
MKALSPAIDAHHALTPELREQIVQNVRARLQDPPYRLLSPEHFRTLAILDTAGHPVVSLYLELTPERRVGRAWKSAFSALTHQVFQTMDEAERNSVTPTSRIFSARWTTNCLNLDGVLHFLRAVSVGSGVRSLCQFRCLIESRSVPGHISDLCCAAAAGATAC